MKQNKIFLGLGTSTSEEFKEYFTQLNRHKIPFGYKNSSCDTALQLAFDKKSADLRKDWLRDFSTDVELRESQNRSALTIFDGEKVSSLSFSVMVTIECVKV